MRRPASRSRLPAAATAAAFLLLLPRAARSETSPPPAEKAETEEQKKDPVRFKARLGYDESGIRAWPGAWNPVFLSIENRGDKPFDAGIAIDRTRDNEGLPYTGYTLRVSMAAGARKDLSTLVYIERGDRRLDVVLQTGRYGARQVFLNIAPYMEEEAVVLVCADEAAGTAAALARPEEEPDANGIRLQRYCNILPVARLPQDRAGFGGVAAVVIETAEAGEIDEARLAALREYVHAGGTLVVSAGRHAAAVQKSALAALLPAAITGSEIADGLDLRTSPGAPAGRVVPGRYTLARLATATAPPVAGKPEAPVIVEAKAGLGRVALLAFSLSELARGLRSREDAPLVGWLLRREPGLADAGRGTTRRASVQPGWIVTSSNDPEDRLPAIARSSLRNDVDAMMRKALVVRFPPVGQIALLLGVYLLFLVPVNWVLWSWTRRKELAWVTAAALSVGFGIGYYQWGARWGGATLSGENVTVVEARSGSPVGRYWSFHSLYAPGHARGDLRLASAPGFARQDPLLTRLRIGEVSSGVRALDYALRWDPACVFADFEIYPRAVRTFEAEGTCALGQGLEVRPDPADAGTVRVTNRTPWTLRRVGTLRDGKVDGRDATVPPGQSFTIDRGAGEALAAGRTPAPDWIPRWEELFGRDLLALLVAPPFVVAWTDADVLHPDYRGYDVGQRHSVMLVVPAGP
jgi:hypothetical protein